MKDLLKIAGIFALLLVLIPSLSFFAPKARGESPKETRSAESIEYNTPADGTSTDVGSIAAVSTSYTSAQQNSAETTQDTNDVLKVLDFTSGQVTEISMHDYVVGAVLAEIPAAYCPEALKAQAVAARTYAVRQREKQRLSPTPELMGADISND
ncbi:MAG: SpoIID/LytB domain-containing protein, partial [Oscillospiraceae bacterium]|nr:SpoIID/LytB domain-containing protein [Oscillospiraceae bacterium]